jgi:hypothetical protein
MKRVDNNQDKIQWKKTGGGSFRAVLDGRRRIIKPGEVFRARIEEIPLAFRDVIIPLDPQVLKKAEEPIPVEQSNYTIVTRSPGWFNVVRESDGKVMNENALRKEDAETLIESLR